MTTQLLNSYNTNVVPGVFDDIIVFEVMFLIYLDGIMLA